MSKQLSTPLGAHTLHLGKSIIYYSYIYCLYVIQFTNELYYSDTSIISYLIPFFVAFAKRSVLLL